VTRASRLALAALLGAALVGCSAVRFVYDNADTYLRWRAGAYFDMNGPLADEVDERIGVFMAWHRAQALPKYADIADDAARRFARGLQPADLVWGYDSMMAQAREAARAAAEQSAPLLDRLEPRDIERFEQGLAEDNRRFARENLRGSERERRRRRTERNVGRLEDWVGRLSQAQRQRVAQYSERAPLLDDMRDRDHKRIQAAFTAIVRAKEAKKRLPEFAAHWERGRDPAFEAALEAWQREYFAMVLDIDRSLTPEQRSRGLGELRRYAEEFRALAQERP